MHDVVTKKTANGRMDETIRGGINGFGRIGRNIFMALGKGSVLILYTIPA